MDEGLPIAYEVLEPGVAVLASDGQIVGTVDHVVAAPHEDIFHGIVIRGAAGRRFVAADQIQSLHERGVDLAIDSAQAATLPEPHGSAPAWRLHEPGVKPSRWKHLVDMATGARPHHRDWDAED
jgi:hypothetical protein